MWFISSGPSAKLEYSSQMFCKCILKGGLFTISVGVWLKGFATKFGIILYFVSICTNTLLPWVPWVPCLSRYHTSLNLTIKQGWNPSTDHVSLMLASVIFSKVHTNLERVLFPQAPAEKDLPPDLNDLVKTGTQERPTVIRWTGGGKDVYISGSFNNWSTKIPLNKR